MYSKSVSTINDNTMENVCKIFDFDGVEVEGIHTQLESTVHVFNGIRRNNPNIMFVRFVIFKLLINIKIF